MTLVILYISTAVIFLGLDYLGLTYLIKPVFERGPGADLLRLLRGGGAVVRVLARDDRGSFAALGLWQCAADRRDGLWHL